MIADASVEMPLCVAASSVSAETHGATFMIVAGNPKRVDQLSQEVSGNNVWHLAAQAEGKNVKTLVFRAGFNIPYREIGGLIYSAQRKRLAVTFTGYPVICEVEKNNAQKN